MYLFKSVKSPLAKNELGKGKTIGLVFLNSSLRTRLSTQNAAQNLGLNSIVLNANQEAWTWEFEDNAIMNGGTVEHVKDAANVLSQYCDIIGIRCFAGLTNKAEDVSEKVYSLFEKFAKVPVVVNEYHTSNAGEAIFPPPEQAVNETYGLGLVAPTVD